MARGFSLQDIACITLEGSTSSQQVAPTSISSNSSSRQQQQQQRHIKQQMMAPPEKASKNDGFLASGLWWFDKQREKRRREHLKLEAQKQLQKIGEAARLSRAAQAATSPNRKTHIRTSSKPVPAMALMIDPSRSLADSSSDGDDDSEKLDEELRKLDIIPSRSFGTSDVSKSGEGASGRLSLTDIDVICGTSYTNIDDQPDDEDIEPIDDNNSLEELDDDDYTIGPVRVTPVPGDDESPYILSQEQMDEIAHHVLPETIKYCRWRRLYGLGRDGDSFDGCLRIIGSEKRTLMVVRTTKGEIFGGYADAPWHSRHDSSTAKFYGSASSCLFSFPPELDPEILVYRWTGKNRYIQVCDVSNKMLAFGGGGDKGAFGLCLQEDFERGTTGHCETFDNEPLCQDGNFDIVDVEFWEFQTGVF